MPVVILKPRLERAADGRVAAAIHVDGADGQLVGMVGPSVHASEADARIVLFLELQNHVRGIDAQIVIDGIGFGRDVDEALRALIVDAGGALLEKIEAPKRRSGPVSISERNALRRTK